MSKKPIGLKDFKIEMVPIGDLIAYVNNPKAHPGSQVDKIASSIKNFGFLVPLVIDSGNEVVCGHGRILAAQKLGLGVVPCVRADNLTPAEIKAFRLADNKVAESEWFPETLVLELKALEEMDFDLSLTGFDLDELEGFGIGGGDPPPEDPGPQIDRAAELQEKWGTALGQIWQVGKHRVMCGDSTKAEDVGRLMGGDRFRLCFTSPPYSDVRDYKGCDLSPESLARFIIAANGHVDLFAVNLGIVRKDGEISQYWNDYIKVARGCGLKLLSWNVWDKLECGSIGNQTAMFGIQHEFIFIFGNKKIELNRTVPNKNAGETANHSGTRQKDGSIKKMKDRIVSNYSQLKTVISLSPQKARNHDIEHPAMFQVELPQEYINACSDLGDAIYDPFLGSGTTLIAAEQLGRVAYGMEISPEYCGVILERAAGIGLVPQLLSDGAKE